MAEKECSTRFEYRTSSGYWSSMPGVKTWDEASSWLYDSGIVNIGIIEVRMAKVEVTTVRIREFDTEYGCKGYRRGHVLVKE